MAKKVIAAEKETAATEQETAQEEVLFTKQEVEFAVATALCSSLRKSVNLLINSGATPSGEIGIIVMHLGNGNKHVAGEVVRMAEALSANPGGVERINMLQEIVSGQVH